MDALGSIGSFFGSGGAGSGLMSLLGLGTTGAGLVGNILNQRTQSQQINKLQSLEDPTKLAKEVAAATAPLNTGLVQGVENQVQGSLASQGLAEAPGIQASVLAQALAPYEQQNQQTALQLVLAQLGIPVSILQNLPKGSNLSPLLAMMMLRQNNPSSSSTSLVPQDPSGVFPTADWLQSINPAPPPPALPSTDGLSEFFA